MSTQSRYAIAGGILVGLLALALAMYFGLASIVNAISQLVFCCECQQVERQFVEVTREVQVTVVLTNTPAPTSTTSAPTSTNTPVPPTSTNTPVPPTQTNTPVPPTSTPVPPTSTNTPVPPTSTNTPVPPTQTNTPVPPTSTPVLTSTPCEGDDDDCEDDD